MSSIKKLLLIFCSSILTLIASSGWAVYNQTLLVLDQRNVPELPNHFRTTADPLPNSMNSKGFAELHIAGGAQFSKLSLEKILQKLKADNLTIIDLREESHGFVNGNAVSWFGPHNAANARLRPTVIEHNQAKLLSELDRFNFVTVNKILKKTPDEKIEKVKPVDYSVHSVASERDVVESRHLKYFRIYTQDYHAPQPKQVDSFIELVRSIPKGDWIYFHCRAGVGRTTTFMTLYDMMQNAKQVSFADIMARQVAIDGKDLTVLPHEGSYKYNFANERLKFLEKFYQYAHDNEDNFQTSWRTWLRKNKSKN